MWPRVRRASFRGLRSVLPGRDDRDAAREIAAHLALLEESLVRQGFTPEAAYTEARRRLGGIEAAKQLRRDSRSFRWLDELLVDSRQAIRSTARHPWLAVGGILILTIVGAANALVFGLADAVLFRPLPYREPGRVHLVRMLNEQTGTPFTRVGNDVLQLLAEPASGMSRPGLLDSNSGPRISVVTPDGTRGIATAAATPNYFDVLGVRPLVGRLFSEEDANRGGGVAVLAYSAWQEFFAGDAAVVGTTATLGNASLDVVGVLPPHVFLPTLFGDAPQVIVAVPYPPADDEDAGAFYPVVRLDSGTSVDRARAALATVARAGGTLPDGIVPTIDPVRDMLFPAGRDVMTWLVACTLALVALAGVNLAGLFAMRGFGRVRETGVKVALGASRTRIVRPMLMEVLLISLMGGASALVAASQAFEPLLAFVPSIVYRNAPVGIDLRVGVMTVGAIAMASVVSTLLATWLPARRDADVVVRSAGGGRTSPTTWRQGRTLVALQVAITVVLVFGAGITARAFVQVINTPLGFDPENVASVRMLVASPQDVDYEAVARSLIAVPGVEAVGGAARTPFDGSSHDAAVSLADGETLGITHILPGYFETIQRPLIAGRQITWSDYRADPGAVVVSAAGARVLAAGGDVLGRSFANDDGRMLHVVGIVADALYSVEGGPQATVYSFARPPERHRAFGFLVRTDRRDDASLDALAAAVRSHVPDAERVEASWWADDIYDVRAFRNPRFQTFVLTTLGIVALTLTTIGVFGVVSRMVASRGKELAVRAALGATPQSLVCLAIRQAIVPVLAGVGAGLVATRWASRFAEAQLFAVDTTGTMPLIATAGVVIVVSFVAAFIPSRRAGRAAPADMLRPE